MKYNTAVFDLDGTILDTLDDLKNSTNYALQKNGFPERTKDEIRSFVGNGIRLLVERAVPTGTKTEDIDRCFLDFKEHYKNNSAVLTKPYPDILNLLKELKNRGVKTAVVSNKADFAVKDLTKKFFPDLFDCSFGERDGVKRKPAPDGVFGAIKEMNGDLKNAVYIGDSDVDIKTSENAGLPCIAVSWGFRKREFLESFNPEYIVDTPEEILRIISGEK